MRTEREWRVIPSRPHYEASSDGLIRRATPARGTRVGKIKKATLQNAGYLLVQLWDNYVVSGQLVHRLVTEAFHGAPPTALHQAAHRDGNRLNNRADNLSWLTRAENEKDKWSHGTHQFGERNHQAKLTAADVQSIRVAHDIGDITMTQLAKTFGVGIGQISRIINRERWAHVL